MGTVNHEFCILTPENYNEAESGKMPACDCEVMGSCSWNSVLKKTCLVLVCAFVLAVLLYFVMPRCVDEPRLTILLYSSIAILLTSLTSLGISYYKLLLEREQDRNSLLRLESSVTLETARRKSVTRERNNYCHVIVTLKLEKIYTERENAKLWREVENLRSKICALESCLRGMAAADGATTDEEEDNGEDENPPDTNCCIICMERERNTVTSPCRHLCLCSNCARKVTHCPLCRKRIKKQMKVFTG